MNDHVVKGTSGGINMCDLFNRKSVLGKLLIKIALVAVMASYVFILIITIINSMGLV